MLNLRQIEVFRAVMQAGSVSGGAARLHVSAPAVSRLLSHLSARLGVALFERHGSRLLPTPEAQALMREVDAAYHHIDRVRSTAVALRHGAGAPLRVATNLSTGLELVPRALSRLHALRPQARVRVEVATLAGMRQALEAGEIDLGVGAFLPADSAPLERLVLGRGELQLVLPAGHPLAARSAVAPAALRSENLIAYGLAGAHGQQLEHLLGLRRQPPALEVPYAYMACALVACGAGVAVVDDLTLRHFAAAGVVARPLSPALHYDLAVLRDPRRPAPAAAAVFVDALRDAWRGPAGGG